MFSSFNLKDRKKDRTLRRTSRNQTVKTEEIITTSICMLLCCLVQHEFLNNETNIT